MAKFLGSTLKALNTLFRFKGSEVSTDTVDLSAVNLVADVTPIARMGAAVDDPSLNNTGYFWAQVKINRTGAGTTYESMDLYSAGTAVGTFPNPVDPREQEIWLLDIAMLINDQTDFSGSSCGLVLPADQLGPSDGSVGGTTFPLVIGDTSITIDSGVRAVLWDAVAPGQGKFARFPIRLVDGQLLECRLSTSGATSTDLTVAALIWIGPRGTLPPA